MKPLPDEVEQRPTPAQQVAGLSLFEPLPVNPRREAHEVIQARADTLRAAVLAALDRAPMTADEVAAAIGESVLAIRPRVAELHQAGAIYNTSERRPNLSGRLATVWAMKQRRGT